MQRLIDRIEGMNEQLGRWMGWAVLLMVLLTFVVVVLRYLFDMGWIAMQESITYLHGAVFMLGAAFTMRHQGHVRVDLLYRRFSPLGQAWVDLLGSLLLLFPMSGFLLWVSYDYVVQSWSLWEGSRESGGLPLVWLLKTLIPLLAISLLLQGLADLLRCLRYIGGDRQPLYEDQEQPGEKL